MQFTLIDATKFCRLHIFALSQFQMKLRLHIVTNASNAAMKIKNSLLLIAGAMVAGCATVKITPQGQAVRTVSPVVAQNCEHLGLVSSWKPIIEGGLSAAQIDIRNKVASLGANAILVISQQIDPPPYQHAQIMAEAYRCDFRRPST